MRDCGRGGVGCVGVDDSCGCGILSQLRLWSTRSREKYWGKRMDQTVRGMISSMDLQIM